VDEEGLWTRRGYGREGAMDEKGIWTKRGSRGYGQERVMDEKVLWTRRCYGREGAMDEKVLSMALLVMEARVSREGQGPCEALNSVENVKPEADERRLHKEIF
jgi:hypothetical protein